MATAIRTIQVPTATAITTSKAVMGKVVAIRPATHKVNTDTSLKIRFQYSNKHFIKYKHDPNNMAVEYSGAVAGMQHINLKCSYRQTTVVIWTGARDNEHTLATATVYCWEPDRFTRLTGRNHAVKAVIQGMPKQFVQEVCDTLKAMKCRWYE